ncbi:PAS-domain containing protein [Pelagovum pacificum]|nr:PAS-domain containing protein [Pelagovum pacificum]QQA42757.1 PAS-domain containing protein [Pelagovum pacificum]
MSAVNLLALLLPASVCIAAIVTMLRRPDERKLLARQMMVEAESSVAFLFDGTRLADTTGPARDLLRGQRGTQPDDWVALTDLLARHFPDFEERVAMLGQDGRQRLTSPDGDSWADVEQWDGFTRICLYGALGSGGTFAPLALSAMEQELTALRALAEGAPLMIWRENEKRQVVWANQAYLQTAASVSGTEAEDWPPRRLFAEVGTSEPSDDVEEDRLPLDLPGGETLWYDVTTIRAVTGSMHFAISASAVVQAEAAQRNFVQTLSKTFADLAIGLAIFDRDRRLVMFNPALMELTHLPVDFLAMRPGISTFLDRLREQRMLPEPKDYGNWRHELAALEARATDGTYCENWALPGGQTFRVTGRPHPDGAIAFLFEDISAEVSLARRFRGQIETANSALDVMDEAIVVFTPGGTVALTNLAYDRLWHGDREDDAVPVVNQKLRDEAETWKAQCIATDFWPDIIASSTDPEMRKPWTGRTRRTDGRTVDCRVVPLPRGATMVGFTLPTEERGISTIPPTLYATGSP